jgi:hypothetical protein
MRVEARMDELEDETSWPLFRLRRLRVILKIITDPHADKSVAETALRELISDAESRLDALQHRRPSAFHPSGRRNPPSPT